MFIALLCVIFAKDLSFSGLTLPVLFTWFCNHPFLFIFALSEIFNNVHYLLDSYCLMMKDDLTQAETDLLNFATLLHVTSEPHHPEYWTDTDLTGFSRTNTNPHGITDATKMDRDSICEMLSDWCAMSEEFGNTPFQWFNKVNGTRYLFSKEQQKFILATLKRMWKD